MSFSTIKMHHILELLEKYYDKLIKDEDQPLQRAVEKLLIHVFQALLDLQNFFENVLVNDAKNLSEKTFETNQVAIKWESRIQQQTQEESFETSAKVGSRKTHYINYNVIPDALIETLDASTISSSFANSQMNDEKESSVMQLSLQELGVETISNLGSGHFGDVFKVKLLSENLVCAMKTLKKDVSQLTKENFQKESEMMKTLNHKNIIKWIGTVVKNNNELNPNNNDINILMELTNQGSLEQVLKKKNLTVKNKCKICIQVAQGLAYLHRNYIIHRDIAARNILVQTSDDGLLLAKISDFGLSRIDKVGLGYKLSRPQELPLQWMAPESFTFQKWTSASDVWGFGILMWEIFTDGKKPFTDDIGLNDVSTLTSFISFGNHPLRPLGINEELWELMLLCWYKDPDKRITMEKVSATLENIYDKMTIKERTTVA